MSSRPVELIPQTPTPEVVEISFVVAAGILGGLFGRLGGLFDELDYPKIAIGFMLALNLGAVYAISFHLDQGNYIKVAAGVAFMAGTAVGFLGFRSRQI